MAIAALLISIAAFIKVFFFNTKYTNKQYGIDIASLEDEIDELYKETYNISKSVKEIQKVVEVKK